MATQTTPQEKLQKLAYEAQVYQAEGQRVQQQIEGMGQNLLELTASLETLRNLKEDARNALVPVGAGVFLKAEKLGAKSVFVSIGGRLVVERGIADAIALLEQREKANRDVLERMHAALEELNSRILEIDKQANVLVPGAGKK